MAQSGEVAIDYSNFEAAIDCYKYIATDYSNFNLAIAFPASHLRYKRLFPNT